MIFLLLLLGPLSLAAQQTIFDVPSADVSVHKDWFYQHQSTIRSWSEDRFWLQTNAYGYGIGHNTEIDATWFNLEAKHPASSFASLGFKTSVPLNRETSKLPLRFIVGDLVQVGSSQRRLGNWAYVMLSGTLPGAKTKLTGGFNSGTKSLFGERTEGFLGGVEQPLSKRWLFQMDWFSGTHDLAYLIPGVVYRFQEHWMLSFGYQIPNAHSGGKHAIVLELTRF